MAEAEYHACRLSLDLELERSTGIGHRIIGSRLLVLFRLARRYFRQTGCGFGRCIGCGTGNKVLGLIDKRHATLRKHFPATVRNKFTHRCQDTLCARIVAP